MSLQDQDLCCVCVFILNCFPMACSFMMIFLFCKSGVENYIFPTTNLIFDLGRFYIPQWMCDINQQTQKGPVKLRTVKNIFPLIEKRFFNYNNFSSKITFVLKSFSVNIEYNCDTMLVITA